MFSVIFPGQGSQKLGMAKEFFDKFELVKKLFHEADEILNLPISKIIFEGPDDELNLTENTQPAIFLTSYSIFKVIHKEFGLNLKNAKYKNDKSPLDIRCDIRDLNRYSKSYLHHLVKSDEILASMLISLNNIYFYQQFMREIRKNIKNGTFNNFYKKYINFFD